MPFVNKRVLQTRLGFALIGKRSTLLLLELFLLLPVASFLGFHFLFWGRIFPGVEVAGIKVGGKTVEQAKDILSQNTKDPQILLLTSDGQEFPITLSGLSFSYNFQESAINAFRQGRQGNALVKLQTRLLLPLKGENLAMSFSLNEEALEEKIATVSAQIAVPALESSVSIEGDKVVVYEGKNGKDIDTRVLKQRIFEGLSYLKEENPRIELPLRELTPQLSQEEAQRLKESAEKLVGKNLELTLGRETYAYPDEQLVALLGVDGKFDQLKIAVLAADVSDGVNREPQNAVFVFRDGRVEEFTPAKEGLRAEEEELAEKIQRELTALLGSQRKTAGLEIPVVATQPKITTEEVNSLGIKELIGRGSSRFSGSITNRVHNIGLAASKINGALVAPGEVFSFNQTLGDISVYTGYQQAYVIKDGRTILGDGGGVCQVSTTFFRAVLASGLPIVERHQHSYRVSYYEQDGKPGFDATIFVPSVDLKVKNDTPGHILVQSIFDSRNATLVFEIYGTDDGRVVQISTPRVWDVQAPPPPLYQDDPTLPAGTVKQVDFAAWGAKTAFDYKVTRDGEVLQDRTFYSNFRPWQAVYLRGVAPTQ